MLLVLHCRFQSVDEVTVHYHNQAQNGLPPETSINDKCDKCKMLHTQRNTSALYITESEVYCKLHMPK